MKRIRLELARDPEHPAGSAQHGYEFIAPITDDGHIDPNGWKRHREKCRVVRFWGSEKHEIGHLIRKPGGNWAFHYDISGPQDDDEAGFRFATHTFNLGDYVSIVEHDDKMRTFRVARVLDD